MRRLCASLVVFGLVATASVAGAQQPQGGGGQGPQTGPGSLNLGVIEIVGRVQKPIASIEVGKIAPKLTLAELRQPFLDRIEEAVSHDPF